MSKHTIRENKTCQNCGKFVGDNFCPYCGQENTEVRHSFIYLVKHFVYDLLHYDNSFWSTIKLLLFSPAALSQVYIGGKRKQYVDPIKLYIFVSFLAFFIPGILPDQSPDKDLNINLKLGTLSLPVTGTDKVTGHATEYTVETVAQLDSLNKIKNIPIRTYYTTKFGLKTFEIQDNDKQERIRDFILHNLSKVLFIYMPIFAFWLWLFHNKKKFLYFDSAIFTLHYFSFLLLIITILNILDATLGWLSFSDVISTLVSIAVFFYSIFYFFRAHRRFYGGYRFIANLKGAFILSIDIVLILIIFTIFTLLAVFVV